MAVRYQQIAPWDKFLGLHFGARSNVIRVSLASNISKAEVCNHGQKCLGLSYCTKVSVTYIVAFNSLVRQVS